MLGHEDLTQYYKFMDINKYKVQFITSGITTVDYDTAINDYNDLIGVLMKLCNSLYEAKIKDEYWMIYSETLIKKFIFNSQTLLQLFKGININNNFLKCNNFVDISSIYILARTQLENLLTFYYLYIQPKDRKEVELRFKLYELSGLSRRQQLEPRTKNTKEKQIKEKIRIGKLFEEIKINPFFYEFTKKEQNDILRKKFRPRLYTWNRLIELSELNHSIIKSVYNMTSNYSHSEYWSLLQLKNYYKKFKFIDTKILDVNLQYSIMIVCVMIKDFCKLYNSVEIVFNTLSKSSVNFIEFFEGVAKNKSVK